MRTLYPFEWKIGVEYAQYRMRCRSGRYAAPRERGGTSRAAVRSSAAVPRMRCAPAAVADVAVAVADVVTAGPTGKRTIEVSGPVEMDLVDVAKAVAAQTGSPRWIFGVRFGGPAIRGGGLVPADPDVVTSTTLDGWLAGRESANAGERR